MVSFQQPARASILFMLAAVGCGRDSSETQGAAEASLEQAPAAIRGMGRSILVLVALLGGLFWAACDTTQPLSQETAERVQTPTGDELSRLSCPEGLSTHVGLAEYLNAQQRVEEAWKATATALRSSIPTSGADPSPFATQIVLPPELYEVTPAPAAPGSLGSLLAPDPVSGRSVPEYTLNTNDVVGSPGYGYYASAQQLDQMGRLCGLYTSLNEFTHGPSEDWVMHVYLDLYATTAGAEEAFQRWARSLGGSSDVDVADCRSLKGVGEERELRLAKATAQYRYDTYHLLFRRRNVVLLLTLNYGEPTARGPVDLVAEYAAQLDRNIEAAAEEQLGPGR
jgi:hypothetical protein